MVFPSLVPSLGRSDEGWRVRGDVWRDDRTVLGGSDAGAHADLMCHANYTTMLLGESVRDRALLTLEDAVRQLTDVPARLYGLRDRGRIAEGGSPISSCSTRRASGAARRRCRHDLPGGGERLYAEAQGIEHVLVNGREIVGGGRLTGDLAGTLLRSGRDTDTVTVPGGQSVADMSERVAFVTGASRGIGKATAVHLAQAGFDVAIMARTLEEGEAREHSSTREGVRHVTPPGSRSSTAALVEAEGRQALIVLVDILDRTVARLVGHDGARHVGSRRRVVNNARYIGPGHMDRLLDTPIELLDKHLDANTMAPIILTKLVLPSMIERKSGCLMTVTSGAGLADPPTAAGEGGWGLGYGMSKGAVHRLIGIVKLEHEHDGIVTYNLHPGFIATERMVQDMGAFGFDASQGAPPDVIGAAAAWLATAPEARDAQRSVGRGSGALCRARPAPRLELAVTGEHPAFVKKSA